MSNTINASSAPLFPQDADRARPFWVDTLLTGDNTLLLRSFVFTEELGRPFELELDLLATSNSVPFDSIIGTLVKLRMRMDDGSERLIHGYVARFGYEGAAGRYSAYSATVVPWIWLLSRRAHSRVFRDTTVPALVSQVCRDLELGGVDEPPTRADSAYPTRPFVVQYRESDFDFISRLLEHEGIYYRIEHSADEHKLVMMDDPLSHETREGLESIAYTESLDAADGTLPWVYGLRDSREIRTGSITLKSYDYENPANELTAIANRPPDDSTHPYGDEQLFEFSGDYKTQAEGERLARIRFEEEQARHQRVTAHTNVLTLQTGDRFELTGHGSTRYNAEYVILRSTLRGRNDTFETSSSPSGDQGITCELELFPAAKQFRPSRSSPRPRIEGVQTAVVAGDNGDSTKQTDALGRVFVHFMWDQNANDPADSTSSIPVRVSQAWAGARHGTLFVPEIGDEVIVQFLGGDPDRPIIVGSVYNNRNTPTPNEAGVRTKTVVGIDDYGNEMMLDSTPGSEHIRIHAPGAADRGQESSIVLGLGQGNGGISFVTNADRHSTTVGDSHSHTYGNSFGFSMGNSYSAAIGDSAGISLGSSQSVSLGLINQSISVAPAAFSFSMGQSASYSRGGGYSYSRAPSFGEGFGTGADVNGGQRMFDAANGINAVGGDKLAASTGGFLSRFAAPKTPNGFTGLMRLDSDIARLSYGKEGRKPDYDDDSKQTANQVIILNVLAVIASAVSHCMGITATAARKNAMAKAHAEEDRESRERGAPASERTQASEYEDESSGDVAWHTAGATVLGIASLAASLGVARKLKDLAGDGAGPGFPKHGDPFSGLELSNAAIVLGRKKLSDDSQAQLKITDTSITLGWSGGPLLKLDKSGKSISLMTPATGKVTIDGAAEFSSASVKKLVMKAVTAGSQVGQEQLQ